MEDLKKLMVGEMRDMYDAEQQLIKVLPQMAEKAQSASLKEAFRTHHRQTQGHARRLEQAFHTLGEEPTRKSCKGMEGIIDEGQLIATEYDGNSALDAALIAAAQKVEHYEITSYGTLCTWAKELGVESVSSLLEENLKEEKETDVELTQLATAEANQRATLRDTAKSSEAAASAKKMVKHGP